jgi:hypothetical protein
MEPLKVNTRVRCHGSKEDARDDVFIVCFVSDEFLSPDEECRSADGKRYIIYNPDAEPDDEFSDLRRVRRQSITPVEDENRAVANPNRTQVA